VFVPQHVFPPLSDDEWYAYQLKGLSVLDRSARSQIGVVVGLVDFGAGDLLEVRVRGKNYYLPFAEPYVGDVDLEEGTVEVEIDEFLE
jgi:16S rRNA processing protein RimM